MLAIHSLETIADSRFGIEMTNPALITRVRRQAETVTPHEIIVNLAQAITDAADELRHLIGQRFEDLAKLVGEGGAFAGEGGVTGMASLYAWHCGAECGQLFLD